MPKPDCSRFLRCVEVMRRRRRFCEARYRPGLHSLDKWQLLLDAPDVDDLTCCAFLKAVEAQKSNEDHYPQADPLPPRVKDDPWVEKQLEQAAEFQRIRRRNEWTFRGQQECERAMSLGWYAVMDTLTFDDTHVGNWVELCTKGWTEYVKRLKTVIVEAAGIEKDAPVESYLSYVACVEIGEAGRPHMHVLWFARDIPWTWKIDPNAGTRVPVRREIGGAKSLWQYGFSAPIAVRHNVNDVWGQLGWQWPYDNKRKRWLESDDGSKIGGYIAKYVTKQQTEGGRSWRIRSSKGFGRRRLNKVVRQLSDSALRTLSRNPLSQVDHLGMRIPIRMLKSAARRARLLRKWDSVRTRTRLCWRLWTGMPSRMTLPQQLRTMLLLALKQGVEFAVSWAQCVYLRGAGSFERWDQAVDMFLTAWQYHEPMSAVAAPRRVA